MLEEQGYNLEVRLRRLRGSEAMRRLVRETRVDASNLVSPIFVTYGENVVQPIPSMPDVYRYSVDRVNGQVSKLAEAGVGAVLLFGIPEFKDEQGSGAYASDGIVPSAIKAIKKQNPGTAIIADVCMCEYTSHGHCGVIRDGMVDNDRTIALLAKAALEYAKAGADVVAPSAMMDGQVQAIRMMLDRSGYGGVGVMGYSAKYASAFYGPFREAAQSAPSFGDRRSYQMDSPNSREAMREIEQDAKEGADIVMVKPALAYLDVLAKARSRFDLPLAAYSVSGEYSMLKAASINGWLDEKRSVIEVLTGIKRAGADIIITYYAEKYARWMKEENA